MLENKLKSIYEHNRNGKIKIMIIGLGSVGNYLLDYLISTADEKLEIIAVGRNREKMQKDVNIVRVASLIRRQNRSNIIIEDNVELSDLASVKNVIEKHMPDFIVNTSRVYAGLKYGTISWHNVRAYGIWIPLSVKYIRNIMLAYEQTSCNAIVINTSYPDGTIPWIKSAGITAPDFGSGNLNHLLPRIKFAVAKEFGIDDFWNIDAAISTAHFHDVVISKEGQNEGIEQLLSVKYKGRELSFDQNDILSKSQISIPTDSKRNMMNASSNFDIIESILRAIRNESKEVFYSPGAFGEIGGYPVLIDGKELTARIDESNFNLSEMMSKNTASIYLDGIESIENGVMTYTNELIEKAQAAFGVALPKKVSFDEIDETASLIIEKIIKPNTETD